jgi:hypothetical protein
MIEVYDEDHTVVPFTHHYDDGCSLRSAEFMLADGSLISGVVEISHEDGGEHCGTALVDPATNTLTNQQDPDFLSRLNRTQQQVFPYRYRYNEWQTAPRDHHIDDVTGWSK